MTYLPNSIERCAPILGFDPYAYIMDSPSNLQINKMQSPYDVDYYAPGPQNVTETPAQSTPKEKKKGPGFLGILKGAAAIASVAAVVVLIVRFKNKIGKIFHKGKKGSGSHKTGKIGQFFKDMQKRFKKGWKSVRTFAGDKFKAVRDFFKKKP